MRDDPLDSEPYPAAGETWFRSLRPEQQVQLARQHRTGLARGRELEAREKRRMVVESLRMGAVFAAGDCLSPLGGLASLGLAFVAGSLAGCFCNRLDAFRIGTTLIGGAAFILAELLLRGGMTLMQIVIAFPVAAACALIGYAREERGML